MGDSELWEAISRSVQLGEESEIIDLKEIINLNVDKEKAKFIKHVIALANHPTNQNEKTYIIAGVLDSDKCPDRCNLFRYVVGVEAQSRDKIERQMNELLNSHVDPSLTIQYRIITPEISELNKNIGVVIICGWTENDELDPRPYVISKPIDNLHEGTIPLRKGTRSVKAHRTDRDITKSCV